MRFVGGGLAGLMTTIKLCEAGIPVDLFSLVPVKRSHSVCAQGGINASVNTKGERATARRCTSKKPRSAGTFWAISRPSREWPTPPPALCSCSTAWGVPFNRTPEGLLDFRRFGGTLFHRTAFAGATTGQQLLYALDEQVRRFETSEVVDEVGITIPGRETGAQVRILGLRGAGA